MLKKDNRLTKDRQYKKTIQEGKTYSLHHLRWFVNLKPGERKVGIVVSNKVSPKATRRNRIKRVIRAFVRNRLEDLPKAWQVIMVKRDCSDDKLRREIEKLASKLNS